MRASARRGRGLGAPCFFARASRARERRNDPRRPSDDSAEDTGAALPAGLSDCPDGTGVEDPLPVFWLNMFTPVMSTARHRPCRRMNAAPCGVARSVGGDGRVR